MNNYARLIDLIKPINIGRINIDSNLKSSFIRVILKMQNYFDEHHYTLENGFDFSDIFNKYILSDSDKKLKIYTSPTLKERKMTGYYSTTKNELVINSDIVNDEELLDHILCHEFIHFIVHNNSKKDKIPDFNITYGGLIDEALTESLTSQICGKIGLYEPHIKMMDFANKLTDNVNKFGHFLKGRTEPEKIYKGWIFFLIQSRRFQSVYNEKWYTFDEAKETRSYVEMQRKLIEMIMEDISVNSIEIKDYNNLLEIISTRPVNDNEWINKNFYEKIKPIILDTLISSNTESRFYYGNMIERYHNDYEKLRQLDSSSTRDEKHIVLNDIQNISTLFESVIEWNDLKNMNNYAESKGKIKGKYKLNNSYFVV